jgi:hypothetical protein
MYALFNEKKELIGYSYNDFPEMEKLKLQKVKIKDEESDIGKYQWIGNMDNGKMVKVFP